MSTGTRDASAGRPGLLSAQSVFDQMSEAVLVADAAGIVRSAAGALLAVFAASGPDLVGSDVSASIPGWRELAAGRSTDQRHRTTGQRRSGETFPIDLSLRHVDEHGERYVVAVVKDVTELTTLETRLHASQKMEALGLLAGGVAHDFNNLVMIVSGYCDTLRRQAGLSDTGRQWLEQIAVAADQATLLTEQLLAFSRRTAVEPAVIDLHAALGQTVRLLERTIGDDIVVKLQFAPGPVLVRLNRSDIGQILINLAINARDAMPEGGTFTIGTRRLDAEATPALDQARPRGDFVELEVRDTGVGMSADVSARVFEPFFTTKPADRGTGLGLATVYRIVTQTGGHISIATAPGQGTRFSILLPTAEPASLEAPAVVSTDGPPLGTETALVVEDEPAVREIVATMLRELGYHTLEAAAVPEACAAVMAGNRRVDLLVSDVVMPYITGPELAERLWKDAPDLRVLFMSGYNDDEALSDYINRAGIGFLRKPFTRLLLARTVRTVLDGPPPAQGR